MEQNPSRDARNWLLAHELADLQTAKVMLQEAVQRAANTRERMRQRRLEAQPTRSGFDLPAQH